MKTKIGRQSISNEKTMAIVPLRKPDVIETILTGIESFAWQYLFKQFLRLFFKKYNEEIFRKHRRFQNDLSKGGKIWKNLNRAELVETFNSNESAD